MWVSILFFLGFFPLVGMDLIEIIQESQREEWKKLHQEFWGDLDFNPYAPNAIVTEKQDTLIEQSNEASAPKDLLIVKIPKRKLQKNSKSGLKKQKISQITASRIVQMRLHGKKSE